jgi:hypothetical protein
LISRRRMTQSLTQDLLKADKTYELLVGRLNTRQSILDRIDLMREVFRQVNQA